MGDIEADARYYEAHKDDEDEWGEPERPPVSVKRRLATMISVRFSPEEAKVVREAAESAKESLSHFVRKATLQRCQHHHYVVLSVSGTAQTASPWATSTKGSPAASEGNQWIPNGAFGSTTAGYVQMGDIIGKA
jgi:Mobilization protein NikA